MSRVFLRAEKIRLFTRRLTIFDGLNMRSVTQKRGLQSYRRRALE